MSSAYSRPEAVQHAVRSCVVDENDLTLQAADPCCRELYGASGKCAAAAAAVVEPS